MFLLDVVNWGREVSFGFGEIQISLQTGNACDMAWLTDVIGFAWQVRHRSRGRGLSVCIAIALGYDTSGVAKTED